MPTKMIKTKATKNTAGIDRVIEHFNLKTVRLLEAACHQGLTDGKHPNSLNTEIEFEVKFNDKTNVILIVVGLKLIGRYKDDSTKEKPPLLLRATFGLRYCGNENEKFDEESIFTFSNVNGMFDVWPFWREYVHSTTGRMGLPALTIPLFKVETLMQSNQELETIGKSSPSRRKPKKSVARKK